MAGLEQTNHNGTSRHRAVRQAPPYRGRLISQAGASEARRGAPDEYPGDRRSAELLKPWIRGESGIFVGRVGDQEYAPGSAQAGLARAIRKMSELWGRSRRK